MKAVLALVAASATAVVTAAPAATPIARTLTVEGPVTELAADGGRVAFAVRHRFNCARVAVWTPPRAVTTLRSHARCVRGDYSPRESTRELTLAGRRAAWVQTAGGNNVETMVWTATIGSPKPVRLAYEIAGDDGVGTSAGGIRGDGNLLVFATFRRCEERDDGSVIACRPGFKSREIDSETVWRVTTSPRPCPGVVSPAPRLCVPVRTVAEEQTPLAVDSSRIAVRRRSGTVEVISTTGAHLARFRFGPGIARAAALHRNDLVVERQGAVDVFDVATEAKKATWPLPAGARLVDLHGGVAVYLAGGSVRLLRLVDGRAERVAAASAAQLEGGGLYYAAGRRITFVPTARLPARFRPATR